MDISHDKHASGLSTTEDPPKTSSSEEPNSVQKWDHVVEEDMEEVRSLICMYIRVSGVDVYPTRKSMYWTLS
jgi:hypothetical protein